MLNNGLHRFVKAIERAVAKVGEDIGHMLCEVGLVEVS
jgi:hypothetical protein